MNDVADAIADPVRREILLMLRGTRLTPGEIARRFTISRPAISRHMRVLRESGLVRDEPVGRQRFYVLDPSPMAELAEWLAQFAEPTRWTHRLDALDTEVRRTSRERAKHHGAPPHEHERTEDTA